MVCYAVPFLSPKCRYFYCLTEYPCLVVNKLSPCCQKTKPEFTVKNFYFLFKKTEGVLNEVPEQLSSVTML